MVLWAVLVTVNDSCSCVDVKSSLLCLMLDLNPCDTFSIRFLFLLLHGFKSNVRHIGPHLTSTEEHESHTVTRTGSQYNNKQRNNFLVKENLVGWRNTFFKEKELNGIVSGPCNGKRFVFLCWRQIQSVVSYAGLKSVWHVFYSLSFPFVTRI